MLNDGFGAECKIEMEIERDMEYLRISNEADKGIWTTRDGRKIPITEMTDAHLTNTINYLKRIDTIDMYYPWIVVMKEELERRNNERRSDLQRRNYKGDNEPSRDKK